MATVNSFAWWDRVCDRLMQVGTSGVNINGLISPLRYDILIRREFFRFHRERTELYRNRFSTYLDEAEQHPYFIWFTHVYVRRFMPQLASSPDALRHAFAHRVRRSVELFDSVKAHGFNRRYPIILRTARTILPTETGKVVSAAVFAGNGCHRLALLLDRGEQVLQRGTFILKRTPTFRPLDNTALLLPALALSEPDYCAFLARRYALQTPATRDELLQQVAARSQADYEEVRAIVAIDGRYLPDTTPTP